MVEISVFDVCFSKLSIARVLFVLFFFFFALSRKFGENFINNVTV